jgi:hypothetical protein
MNDRKRKGDISGVLDTAVCWTVIGPLKKSASSSSDSLRKGTRHSDWVESTRNSCVQEHAVETPLHDLAGMRRKPMPTSMIRGISGAR